MVRIHARAIASSLCPLIANAKLEFRDGRSSINGIDSLNELVNRNPIDNVWLHPCFYLFQRPLYFALCIHSVSLFLHEDLRFVTETQSTVN